MTQIIPALITEDDDAANDFEELKARFQKIEPFLASFDNWIQLDITDGKFVEAKTHLSFEDVSYFTERANVDLHLMIQKPEKNIEDWILTKPKRITFHIESFRDKNLASPQGSKVFASALERCLEQCRKNKIEIGLALNPETPNSEIEPWLDKVDLILFLGVHPGRGGQKFIPEVLEKIEALCAGPTRAKIGLDGGVNLEIAQKAKTAGAEILFIGNYIFHSDDLGHTIESLKLL